MTSDEPRRRLVDGRLAHDVAPEWPRGQGDLSYRVVITGEPDIDCTLAATLRNPDRTVSRA